MRVPNLIAVVLIASVFCVTTCDLPSCISSCSAAERTWVDSTGNFRIAAELVKVDGTDVVLKTSEGREIRVPLDKLSRQDRLYLEQRTRPSDNSTPPAKLPTENDPTAEPNGLVYSKAGKFRMKIGAEVTAQNGECNNLVCTFPFPKEWPEQTVTIVDEDVSPSVTRRTQREINGGVVQYEFRVPRLSAGQSAHVILTVEVVRTHILPPPRPQELRLPSKVGSEMRVYMNDSPFIETKHSKVKAAAAKLPIDENDSAWTQVEAIYNWTWEAVQPSGTRPLKGALEALISGTGDCEERTSLFVAMCRLRNIPARSVWIPGHTYPEFYLEDTRGTGHWIPCESLGEKRFGTMPTYSLILQKGDNFRMTQKRGPQRYVTATLSGTVGRSGGQPVLKEIREPVNPVGGDFGD